MKHLKLFFALFAMLALGVSNAWAETDTYDFKTNGITKKSGPTAGNMTSSSSDVVFVSKTGNTTDSWTIVFTGDTYYGYGKNTGVQFGSKNYPPKGNLISKSYDNVSQVELITTTTSEDVNMSVKVGAVSFGEKVLTSGNSTSQVFSGTPTTGAITVSLAGSSKNNIKIEKIIITYGVSSGGGSDPDEPETPVVTIELDKTEATLNLEETLTLNATVENSEETIVWASDKESVATVSNGVVTAIGAGKANITATVEGVTATCVVTVKDPNAPAWTLVTDASTLKAGDKIVIAGTGDNSNYALSIDQKSNNRGAVAATKTDDKIEEVDNMQILTLETGTKTGTFAFNTGSGYLYAASSSSNYLRTQTTNNDNGSWTIAIADGAATVVAQGTSTHNTMRYNYNNGSPLFAAYTSSSTIGALVAIYTQAKPAGTPDAPTLTASQEFETETFTVEISAVDGATIHYTLDGNDPTEASTTYSEPFTVNATTTVKAIAVKDGVASYVATATYTKVSVIEKTCAEAADLCTSDESTDKYRVEGYVTAIETAYSAQYNNITVWMADTKDGGNVLQAFRATPTVDADKAVKVGDQIEVVGKLKLYNSVPEIVSGTYTITQLDPVYNVNITSAHGTVTATPASAVEGTEITLSVDVESGWVFQSWTVTDASSNPIEVVDNKFTMPASDVTVVANYTESVAPDAVLKLSANGVVTSNTYKVGEIVKLPETIENTCVKEFVGWSADASCAIAPEYAPGADFTLTAEEHTLYAVYGTQTGGGEGVLTKMTSTDAFANGDKVVIVAYGTQLGMYQETSGTTYVKYWELVGNEPTVAELDDKTIWDVEADGENWKIGDATIGYLYNASSNNLAVSTTNASTWTITWNENGFVFKSDLDRYMACRTDLTTSNKNLYRMNGTTVSNNSTYEMDVYKYTSSAPIYSEFSTTCAAALAEPTFSLTEGEYNEAKTITISATEGDIYYTLDGNIPTKESTPYTEAIVLDECGTTTIKAIAISSDNESPVASATYTINLPITNTEATAYTPAEAIAIIDGACDKTEEVYVKGVVVSTSGLNTEYGNYDNVVVKAVDDESATPTEFTFFRLFKAAEKTKFTASDEVIGVGDIITAKGKLTKYNTTYELAEGCYLVSRVANVKLDAELAWNPETVTLTVGDAFTAPTLINPHLVADITYESSNEDVATVSAEGFIALVDDAVGTATITASFLGDATYKPAEVTCTIKVKPVQEDCEGSDDFETLDVATQYGLRKTTAGWIAENAAVAEIEGNNYIIINGKTSTVGTITSPELNGGIGSIKIRYANKYSEANGVSFRLDIKQNGEVVKTYTITKANADVVKGTVYTELIENINVAGDFQMVFTNLHPTNNNEDNKDRVSIGRLCWTGYEEAPQGPEIVTLTYNLTTDAIREHMSRRYVTAEDATLGEVQIILPSFSAETTEYAEAFLIVGSETLNATATYAADAENNLEVYTATATSEDGATIYNVTMNVTVPATQEYTFLATNGAEYVTEDQGEEGDPFIVYKISGEGYLNDETVAFDMSVDQMGYLEANINDVYVMGTATNLVEEEGTIWLQGSANDETGNTYSIEIYVAQAVEEVEIVITENVDVTLENLKLEVMGNMAMVTAGEEELSFWLTLLETENYYGNYSADMFDNIWYGDLQLQAYGDGIYNRNGLVVSFISEPDAEGNATKYNFTLKPETYTREGLTAGNFGTICLPFGSTNYTGAEFYEFVGKEEGKAYLASVTTLVAGVPYIFRATATELAVYSDGRTAATPGEHNGLVGTFTDNTEVAAGNYIISNNAICRCEATCYVNANRAYIVWDEIPAGAPQQMPGRRYIGMDVHGENGTTGLDNIMTTDAPAKVIVNGQLIIIRDGVKYNVQGQKL